MTEAARRVVGPGSWFDRHTPTFAARYRGSRAYRFLTWTLVVLLPVAVALHLYQVVQKHRYDPRRQPAGQVTLLVTSTCPFSQELEAALTSAGIPYRRLDIDQDDGGGWAFLAVNGRGVPVTVVGDAVVYGLRTRQLRATLHEGGRDVSKLRFIRETDGPMATAVRR